MTFMSSLTLFLWIGLAAFVKGQIQPETWERCNFKSVPAGVTLDDSERALHLWARAHSHGTATRNFHQALWHGINGTVLSSVLGTMVFNQNAVEIDSMTVMFLGSVQGTLQNAAELLKDSITVNVDPWSNLGERWNFFHRSYKDKYGASFPNFVDEWERVTVTENIGNTFRQIGIPKVRHIQSCKQHHALSFVSDVYIFILRVKTGHFGRRWC